MRFFLFYRLLAVCGALAIVKLGLNDPRTPQVIILFSGLIWIVMFEVLFAIFGWIYGFRSFRLPELRFSRYFFGIIALLCIPVLGHMLILGDWVSGPILGDWVSGYPLFDEPLTTVFQFFCFSAYSFISAVVLSISEKDQNTKIKITLTEGEG